MPYPVMESWNGNLNGNGQVKFKEEPKEWFPTKESKKDLEEARRGRDDFRQWIMANVKEVQTSSNKDQPNSLPSIHEALSKSTYEQSVEFIESYTVVSELGNAVRARSDLSFRRSKGVKRFGHGIEKFAGKFLVFLRSCKGIVNIASSADNGFAGMAYETLNILFTVIASKQKVEEELTSTLEDMKERLPDLIVYDRIYQNAVLGRKIAAVYKGIIYFSREASKYCLANHGIKRWGKVLAGPKNFYSPDSSFQKDILAVRNQCEVQLAVKVDQLKKLSEEQKQKLDQLLKAQALDRLVEFRTFLNQPPSHERDHSSSLVTYKELLSNATENDRVEQLPLHSLLSLPEIATFISSPQSQLLILSGQNEYSTLELDDLSWLSPAAINLRDHLVEKGSTVVHYLCQDSVWSQKEPLSRDIIASLSYQILHADPDVLQCDEYAQHRAHIEGLNLRNLDARSAIDILFMVLKMRPAGKETYILIDRMDRVKEDTERRTDFLRALRRIVMEVEGRVKILCVVNSLFWDLEKEGGRLREEGGGWDGGRVVWLRKDQEMNPDRW